MSAYLQASYEAALRENVRLRVEVERLQIALQKVMARCADLLDEDQFNELDALAGGEGR
jgi:hypothetical protein